MPNGTHMDVSDATEHAFAIPDLYKPSSFAQLQELADLRVENLDASGRAEPLVAVQHALT